MKEKHNEQKGHFITFEGCDGSGKSTQKRLLAEYLRNAGYAVTETREPGGTPVSEQIRAVILNPENKEMNEITESFLYAAARAQHVAELIRPAVEAGRIVLCDRYADSSFAYQAYARGLSNALITKLFELSCNSYLPGLTFFLDFPPAEAFERKHGRGGDRLEGEGAEFYVNVYKGFKELAKKSPKRIVTIDARGTKFETHEKIINVLKSKKII